MEPRPEPPPNFHRGQVLPWIGKVVLDGTADELRDHKDVKEFLSRRHGRSA